MKKEESYRSLTHSAEQIGLLFFSDQGCKVYSVISEISRSYKHHTTHMKVIRGSRGPKTSTWGHQGALKAPCALYDTPKALAKAVWMPCGLQDTYKGRSIRGPHGRLFLTKAMCTPMLPHFSPIFYTISPLNPTGVCKISANCRCITDAFFTAILLATIENAALVFSSVLRYP